MAKSKSPRHARLRFEEKREVEEQQDVKASGLESIRGCSRMATKKQIWCVRVYSRILASFELHAMKEYDVIIIGGGIHGAGVLQAAAAAGHSALLIERTRSPAARPADRAN